MAIAYRKAQTAASMPRQLKRLTGENFMTLKIRRARAGDIPAILALQADSLRKLSVGYYSHEQIEVMVRSQSTYLVAAFKTGCDFIFIGEIDQQLVATASLTTELFSTRRSPRLSVSGVYVHPEFARRGISRQMLQKMEKAARRKNVNTLTVRSSLAAIPFYRAMGYVGNQRISLRAGWWRQIDCVKMSKSLAGEGKEPRQNSLLDPLVVAALGVVVIVLLLQLL